MPLQSGDEFAPARVAEVISSLASRSGGGASPTLDADAKLATDLKLDSLGRVWQTSDDNTHAVFEYDALSNVIHVILNPSGASGTRQHRRFDYDGRGVLVTSEPPELRDASGTGRQTFVRNSYDARGHITAADLIWGDPSNQGGSLDGWRLRFDYDSAERLTQVWQPAGGGTRKILKNYTLYGADDALIPARDRVALEEILVREKKDWSLHVFGGAGHAFANDTRADYRSETAEVAWDRASGFLRRTLAA